MQLVLISPTEHLENEQQYLVRLFENGLTHFHLRKPAWPPELISKYLMNIPAEFHDRIVLHAHFELLQDFNLKGIHFTGKYSNEEIESICTSLKQTHNGPVQFSASLHRIVELEDYNEHYDYVFFSPVFKSISKAGYMPMYDEADITRALKKTRYAVVALGGIDADKIDKVSEMGFYGAAVLGAVWEFADPLAAFMQIRDKAGAKIL